MARSILQQTIICPNAATAEVLGDAISPNLGVYGGLLCMVKVVTPNVNTITFIVKLYDRNDVLLWTSAALAENSGDTGYSIPVSIPLTYGEYFSVTPSGNPGADAAVVINADYIPD
jgi:hypothetical protein